MYQKRNGENRGKVQLSNVIYSIYYTLHMANQQGGAMPWIDKKESKGTYITFKKQYYDDRFDVLKKYQKTVFEIHAYIENKSSVVNKEYDEVRFKSIMSMIYNATNVHCISYHSLKGFVFVVECQENGHEPTLDLLTTLIPCVDPTDDGCFKERTVIIPATITGHRQGRSNSGKPITKYNTRIKKFILKISFLNDKTVPYIFRGSRKETDIRSEFVDEAQTQAMIFENTYDFVPITYSVLDLSIIETPEYMNNFLQLLQLKTNTTQDYSILSEMMKINKTDKQMGLLSMEYGEKYKVYSTLRETDNFYKNVTIQILFNMMILFVEYNIVHVDLHKNNIMVYHDISQIEGSNVVNTKNGIKPYAFIIDYGRKVENISNNFEEYFTYMNNDPININEKGISKSIGFIVQQIKKDNKKTINDILSINYKIVDSKNKDLKYVLLLLYSCYFIIKMMIKYEFDYYKQKFSRIYFQSFHIYKILFNKDKDTFKNKINDGERDLIIQFFNDRIDIIKQKILESKDIDIKNTDIANFIRNDELYKLLDYLFVFYIKWKSTAKPNIDESIFTVFEKTIKSQQNVVPKLEISDSESNTIIQECDNISNENIPKELQKLRRGFLTAYLKEKPIL